MRATTFAPFRPLRYQIERVGNLGAVWAPPYDVISPEMAAELRGRHSHNIVRLTNPEGEGRGRYRQAAARLEEWIAEGGLGREGSPAFYVHRHSFRTDGDDHERTGVWGLLRLAPFGSGAVLPHEMTMSGPKADRLALMRACGAQLSPIFFICSDPEGQIGLFLREHGQGEGAEPAELPEGERHEIWRVEGEPNTGRLASLMQDQIYLIADGHHRYETALAYRDALVEEGFLLTGKQSHEYVLAYVVPEGDPGLLLLPTHRVIGGGPLDIVPTVLRMADRFEIVRLDEAEVASVDTILAAETGRPTFVLVARGTEGGWLLRLMKTGEGGGVPSVALHDVFLSMGLDLTPEQQADRVSFVKESAAAVEAVRTGSAQAAALLAASTVAQVRHAVAEGKRLPAKTTYFWPKVPTGPAIHPIDPNEEVTQAFEG